MGMGGAGWTTFTRSLMIDEIRELYAYNRWADRRVLEAAARMPEDALARDLGSSHGSVRDTLAHILAAEWIWLTRWRGTSPTGVPPTWDLSTVLRIREQWSRVHADTDAFITGLTDTDLAAEVSYRNTHGETFASPLWRLLRHVVNHSSYHRGQVVGMLRQLGGQGVATDLVMWYRDGMPA